MGFLEVCFEVGEGKMTPPLKGNSKHFLPPVNSGKKLNLEVSFKTKSHM